MSGEDTPMMKFSLTSRFARLAAVFMLLGMSAAVAETFPTRCVQESGSISDFLNYSLYITVPTTGYDFSLVRTRVKKDVVNIFVKYTLEPGLHGDILQTHRIRFTLIAPHFASRYTVTANGRRLGRPKDIVQPRG